MQKIPPSQSRSSKSIKESYTVSFDRIFLAHPRSVNETYFEHMRFALNVSGQLSKAAFSAFIHALLPCLFQTKASQIIITLYKKVLPKTH